MHHVLSMILGSMHADLARMDHVAMNIANVQTPGYKRGLVSVLPFSQQVDQAADRVAGSHLSVRVDHSAGTLRATGQKLDIALAGAGWFEVMTPAGAAYTRRGDFRVDAQGRLVTQQGHPVMGTAGEIQLPHAAPLIDETGRIREGSLPGAAAGKTFPISQLKVVQFAADAAVQRLGEGLVRIDGEPTSAPEGAVQFLQGYVENSNVSHMHEMVRLMETVRHMETLQKLATGYDEMLGTSIRKLGEGA